MRNDGGGEVDCDFNSMEISLDTLFSSQWSERTSSILYLSLHMWHWDNIEERTAA